MDKETTVSFAREIIDLAARKCLSVQELRNAAEIAKRMANQSLVESDAERKYSPITRREIYEAKEDNK